MQLFTELDAKSGDLIREWNSVLRIHRSSKDSISSQSPARATRLLNRSRVQQSTLSNTGSDSPRSIDSLPHKHLRSSLTGKDIVSSSDDLLFIDKSFRNAMIQDVQNLRKQLTRLRRILQDSETLNPFEQSNGKLFASCELDSSGQLPADDKDTSSLASSIADDPRQELADLRRQVVYLQDYFYSRVANPSRNGLERCMMVMDNAKYAIAFASGIGAMTATISMLTSGDHILCALDIYGGTSKIVRKQAPQFGMEFDFVEEKNLNEVKSMIKDNTKLVIIETPSNPTIKVVDIQAIADILKGFKKQKMILAVDNTFLSPYFQRPLELGADISISSLTKYINGHSDVTMGAATTNCPDIAENLRLSQKSLGIIPSPFDCYQVTRSLKTLALRMEQHSKNSLIVAKFLENHPIVESVFHPALPSHPQHEIALKQSYGHSGIIAFYVKGDITIAKKFLNALELVIRAGSLGGPESTICLPVFVSHSSLAPELKAKLGITENLIRFSVGLEDAESIIADLDQALKKSQQ